MSKVSFVVICSLFFSMEVFVSVLPEKYALENAVKDADNVLIVSKTNKKNMKLGLEYKNQRLQVDLISYKIIDFLKPLNVCKLSMDQLRIIKDERKIVDIDKLKVGDEIWVLDNNDLWLKQLHVDSAGDKARPMPIVKQLDEVCSVNDQGKYILLISCFIDNLNSFASIGGNGIVTISKKSDIEKYIKKQK